MADDAAPPSLDATDARILHELQRDGRLSNQDLAKRVGLSPAPCWRRLKRLEETGVIEGYAALVDPQSIGLSVIVYASISLDNHHESTLRQFDELVSGRPEVLECYTMSGQFDYLLKIVARTMSDYERFLTGHLLPCAAVRAVTTSFVLKRKKFTTALPVQ